MNRGYFAYLLLIVLLAACGDSDSDSLPSVTDVPPVTAPPGDSQTPTAACSPEAVFPVVSAALDPDDAIPGGVEISECKNGYARVFYVPDEPSTYETEQVFLKDAEGTWIMLTSGTGIDCMTDTDLEPAELEDACRALGLRP